MTLFPVLPFHSLVAQEIMLVFVIPIKSAQVANSWKQTCKLLERTLRSVCNQTSDNFRVIVVCHEKPQVNFQHPNISYEAVNFPSPESDQRSKDLDRVRKEIIGIMAAKQFAPCHIMKTDADDCVSKYLAEFVGKNPQSNGWFVDKGYVYSEGDKSIYLKQQDFYRWSGSSNIVRYDLYDVIKSNLEELPETDEECLKYYITHFEVMAKMAERGFPLQPLPFFGAVYILGTGENSNPINTNPHGNDGLISYRKPLLNRIRRMLFEYRPLTRKNRDEFGIYDLNGNSFSGKLFVFDFLMGVMEILIRGIEPTFSKYAKKS